MFINKCGFNFFFFEEYLCLLGGIVRGFDGYIYMFFGGRGWVYFGNFII